MSWSRHRRPRIGGGIEMTLDLFTAAGGQEATVGATRLSLRSEE